MRIFHGICSAIISILLYSLTISYAEKGKTQSSLGRLEVAYSIGSSTGFLVDSVFFKIGGYPLPFFVAGFCSFISFCLTFKINDKNIQKDTEEKKEEDNYNYLKYLYNPEILAILIGFIIIMITITFYIPCLTNHLNNNYSISVSTASLIFMTPMIPYMIVMQFLDALTGKFGNYLVFIIGVTTLGVSSLMIYPVPPLPQSIIIIIFGFLICGCGGVPVFIPGLVMLAKNIKKSDKSIDEMSANDIATVLNTLCTEIGDFLGPLIGGYLSEKIGFKLCCLTVSAIVLTYAAIFILFFNAKIRNDIKMIGKEKKSESKGDK
jgi:predicted MFS family arabinose efflux permease